MKKWFIAILLATVAFGVIAAEFVHPGAPLTREDLDYVKANLQREPWKSGYEMLRNDTRAKLDYKMRGPLAEISRFPGRNSGLGQWRNDMTAVFYLSLMWYFTGDEAYARKGRDILVGWAETQQKFDGWESMLDLGDYVHRFAGGAEILRGTWRGWRVEDTRKVQKLFREVYLPATGFTGRWIGPANKGTLAIVSAMGMAVFLDDRALFDDCVKFLQTHGPSALPNMTSLGQIGESGRDLGHNYGQWLAAVHTAEIAWKQGVDLFSRDDNRFWAVGEYYARHQQGDRPMPFVTLGSTDALYRQPCRSGWEHGRRGFYTLLTAYKFRKKLPTPAMDFRVARTPVDAEAFLFYRPGDRSQATAPPDPAPALRPLSTGLQPKSIGRVAPDGKLTQRDGVWTMRAGGEEIWRHGGAKGGDSFFFAFRELEGDFALVARVDGIEATRENAKAALMMRSSLKPDTPIKAWVAATPGKSAEWFMSGWSVIRGSANWEKGARKYPDDLPVWLKLVRIGTMVYQYWSPDGASWTALGAGSFDKLGKKVYAGLAVCSLANGEPITVRFSRVAVTGGDGLALPPAPDAPKAVIAEGGAHVAVIRWTQSANAERYRIARREGRQGEFTPLAETAAPYWIDRAVRPGVVYEYRIVAANPSGASRPTEPVVAEPTPAWRELTGSGVSAASRNSGTGARGSDRAFDRSYDTGWFSSQRRAGANLRYDLTEKRDGAKLAAYVIAVPPANPEFDPVSWLVEGSNDNRSWTELDRRENQKFPQRAYPYLYELKVPSDYRYYRLKFTKTQGQGIHIAEWQLLTQEKENR